MAAPRSDAGAAALAIEPFPGLAVLGDWWRDLESRADPTFFLSWHWVGALLSESAITPLIVTARRHGQLVAIALLQSAVQRRHGGLLRSRTLFLNETGDPAKDSAYIEHNGFLVDRGFGPALEARLVAFLATRPGQGAPPAFDELRFAGVPARYLDHARATGLDTRLLNDVATATVDLDAVRRSGRDYLDHLSANRRYQIRRAMRQFPATAPLTLDVASDVDEAHRFLDALADLHQRHWTARGRPGAFAHEFMMRFHRRVIATALPAGAVELLRARAGDQVIGYLYNFVYRGWVGAYCTGYAYDGDAKAKPGYVSLMLCVDRYLALGHRVFDFLAGDDRYKTSLGRGGEHLVWFDLQQPRLALKIESALRRWRSNWRGGRQPKPADEAE